MKRYYIILLITGLAFLLPSCRQIQEEQFNPGLEMHELTAVLEGDPETKTQLGAPGSDGVYYPFWSEKDDLAVYADGVNTPDTYVLSQGAGTARGIFKGSIYGERMVAVYPSSIKAEEGLKDDVLHLDLPYEQFYEEGSFGKEAFPMLAVTTDGELSFKNLCSVIKLSLTGNETVSEIWFSSYVPVSGKASVRTDYTGEPELVVEGGTEDSYYVCLTANVQLDPEVPTDFFLVVPPGTYSGGFYIDIYTSHGWVARENTNDVVLERSKFYTIPAFVCEGSDEEDPSVVPSNQIKYKVSNNTKLTFAEDAFDRNIVSHTMTKSVGTITFDGPVTRVGARAFATSWLVRDVWLPNSVEYIGDDAFRCSTMSTFHVPSNLESAGESIFNSCPINSFTGRWATSDGRFILLKNGHLVARAKFGMPAYVTLPKGTRRLSALLFQGDQDVKQVVIPEGVTTLYENTFAACHSLTSIYLPASLTQITGSSDAASQDAPITTCYELREFQGESPLIYDEHTLVSQNGALVSWVGRDEEECIIPEGVQKIAWAAFDSLPNLRSITFPKSLRNVGGLSGRPVFNHCSNLEFFYGDQTTEDGHGFVLGDFLIQLTPVCPSEYMLSEDEGIRTLEFNAFRGNPSIEILKLPNTVEFAYPCFQDMPKLRILELSAGLKQFYRPDPFAGSMALEELRLRSTTPPEYSETNGDKAKWGADNLVIYVPFGSEEKYKAASGWSKYADRIRGYEVDYKPQYYTSSDYSHDGEVVTLQSATEGNGIDLVLMGDAFSDRQIEDGTYDNVMHKMMEAFFSVEPYTTYRNLFNVSYVKVVSLTEGYTYGGQALEGKFGKGTRVEGNHNTVKQYATKAVPESKLSKTLIIVAMNSRRYAGTAHMFNYNQGDYGNGLSIAYFPIGATDESLRQLVHHEACGHGFAKLDDEYAYQDYGAAPSDYITARQRSFVYGWWKNIDFTSDLSKIKWHYFIDDARYNYEHLGAFEGASTYWTGVWRPTENSIMRYNTGGFNAPSREAIWYRIHKLAYGDSWQYNYEDFVEYDAVNRRNGARYIAPPRIVELPDPSLIPDPPVVYDYALPREASDKDEGRFIER